MPPVPSSDPPRATIGAPSTVMPNAPAAPTEVHRQPALIPMTDASIVWINGSPFVAATGSLDKLAHPGDELYAVVTTANEHFRTQHSYSSAPIPVHPDGVWEALVKVDPPEARLVTIRMYLLPPCGTRPSDSPLCGPRSLLDRGAHSEGPADIPTQPGLSIPVDPANPLLGSRGIPGPVGPLVKDGPITPPAMAPVDPPGILGPLGLPETKRPNVEGWLERDGPSSLRLRPIQ